MDVRFGNFVGEFGGGTFWGDVWEALLLDAWGRGELADDGGGLRGWVEAAGIGGGELESVEDDAAVLEVDHVGGDSVDGFGDGDLDGGGVFQGAEVEDGAFAFEVGAGDDGVAVDAVGSVETVVEVAEDLGFKGNGLALQAVGADVAAEWDLHGAFRVAGCWLLVGGGYPPFVNTVICGGYA